MKPPKADTGPPERWQHDEYVDEEIMTAGVKRRRVETQTALDRYFKENRLSTHIDKGERRSENQRLHAVGTEYAHLAYRAGLCPYSGMGLDLVRVDGQRPDPEHRFQALERIRKTDSALGATAADVLWWVCVADYTAASWARGRGFIHRSVGLAFLIDALRDLAKHWGR